MSKLVIFDLDGVLVEAKEIHFDALNSSLKNLDEKYVISWEEHLRSYDGLKTYDKLKLLSLSKGLPLDKDVQEKIFADKQIFTSKALNNLQINETLIGILSKLKEQNFNIACCSNSVKNTVDLVLQKLGIDNFFDLKSVGINKYFMYILLFFIKRNIDKQINIRKNEILLNTWNRFLANDKITKD